MPHSRNGSLCLLVLLLSYSLRECACEAELVGSSDSSGRLPHKPRRTLRTQHSRAGSGSRNITDSQEAESLHLKAPEQTTGERTDQQEQEISSQHETPIVVLASDAPSSVSHSEQLAPFLPGENPVSLEQQLRIPKILHQLYFVSDKTKDYETGTVVDKQFPKKWQASCKAAFPDWEYR